MECWGHPILEPIDIPMAAEGSSSVIQPLLRQEFSFTGPTFEARGRVTDEGFLILKGSTAAPDFKVGSSGYQRMREKLVEDGVLLPDSGRLVFTRDISANSSSQAASIVAGGNRSGPFSWKSNGKTLGDLESDAVSASSLEQ